MKIYQASYWGIGSMAVLLIIAQMLVFPEQCQAKCTSEPDSLSLIKNSIRKVRSQSETIARREERHQYELSDSVPTAIERTITWKEFDRNGNLLSQTDSLSASDREAIEVVVHTYTYAGIRLVSHYIVDQIIVPAKRNAKPIVKFISMTDYTNAYKRVRTEQQESGQWNVQTDSTIFNSSGQPRITYTFNSMRDSFVEEFTYDEKARLKYRRLTMKQFWSPPWEMESTSYTYTSDGGKLVVDSVWRMNPDLAIARSKAGDRNAADYTWKILMIAPTTGSFDRLESRKERTYDNAGRLVLSQLWAQPSHMWEEDSWTYNEKDQLTRTTEYRGDRPGDHSIYGEPCVDTVWYYYGEKFMEELESSRICNGLVTGQYRVFYDGIEFIDPNRVESYKYTGNLDGCKEVSSTYRLNQLQSVVYSDGRGLPIREVSYDFYRTETVTEYSYVHW